MKAKTVSSSKEDWVISIIINPHKSGILSTKRVSVVNVATARLPAAERPGVYFSAKDPDDRISRLHVVSKQYISRFFLNKTTRYIPVTSVLIQFTACKMEP